MPIMARRPLAISEFNFFFLISASSEVITFQPKSPSYAGVPGICFWEISQKAMYAKICAQPATGTFPMAARPFGMSANFKSMDGDKYPGNLPVILGSPHETTSDCNQLGSHSVDSQ